MADTPTTANIPIGTKSITGGTPMWLSEQWASRLNDIANWVFIVSLVVGVVATWLIIRTGNIKEVYLRKQLAGTNERAAKLELDVTKLQGDNLKLSNDLAGKDAVIETARAEAAKAQATAEGFKLDIGEVNRQAAEASSKAEGFRLDIAKANENAAEANRVAEEERLKRVQIEERMKPRSLKLGLQAMSALEAYKGTEYTFSSVFADEESITLLKELDAILLSAGWTRVKPPHAFPAINVYGQEQDFAVASSLSSNIKISVDSDISLATLQAMPIAQLPAPAGAAVVLAMELASGLTPPQDGGVKANVQPGKSMTVRIEIGRKP